MALRAGLRHALDRSKLSGWQLETLVGHCTFACCDAVCLSAFHCSYQLTSYSYDLEMPVWDELVAELQCIRSLLSLGISQWQDKWNEFVYQSGASLTGYGVRCAHLLREQVERAGRISEWSRFKVQEFCRARENALASPHLKRWSNGDWTVDDSASNLCNHWAVDPRSEEIPAATLVEVGRARVCGSMLLTMMLLEARAAVKAMRRTVVSRHGWHTRQLLL